MIEEIVIVKEITRLELRLLTEDIEIIQTISLVSNTITILLIVKRENNFYIVSMRQDHYLCR